MSGERSSGISATLLNLGDIFSRPVNLNVHKKETMTTSLGGILSLILILVVLAQGAIYAVQMVGREHPQILQINEFTDDPPSVVLDGEKDFNFAVLVTVDGKQVNMTEASILTFLITSNVYLRQSGGDRLRYKSQVNLAPCNNSDFPDETYGSGTFNDYKLNYAFCPVNINYTQSDGTCPDIFKHYPNCIGPTKFDISGSYLSPDFGFVQANFFVCDSTNASLVKPYSMECMDLDTVNGIFQNDTEVKANIYFANNVINSGSYETPSRSYLDNVYWNVNPNTYKMADIFINREIIQDYSSYYSSDKNYNQTFYTIDTSKLREQQTTLYKHDNGQTLLQFNIRRSTFNLVTTRVFMKIQDILALIGGFSKSIIFVFAFIAIGYARYKYQMVLSNELYDFRRPEDDHVSMMKSSAIKHLPKMKEESNGSENTLTNKFLDNKEVEEQLEAELKSPVSCNEEVKEFFKYQKDKKKRLDYSEISYFKSLLCCCRKKTPEQKLGEKARDQVEEDVDLVKILKKIKEVDKLKILLLDRNQRELFNYIPKPVISNEEDGPADYSFDITSTANEGALRDHLNNQKEEFESLSKFGRLYVAYREARDSTDPLKGAHNKKLLAMLGPGLIRVFRHVDNEVGPNADPHQFEEAIHKIMNDQSHVLKFSINKG